MKTIQILLAEDNPGDVLLVEQALRAHKILYQIHLASNGWEAESYLDRLDDSEDALSPDVFLLDLHLPKADGHELLFRFRSLKKCKTIPVVIVSGSNDPIDRERSTNLEATRYFRKPSNPEDFFQLGAVIKELVHGTLLER